MKIAQVKAAKELSAYDSKSLLRGMSNANFLSDKTNLPILKQINTAADEMDKVKDVGLTLKFDKIRTLVTGDGKIPEWFGGTGEFYIIASVLDGSGENFEYKTKYFQGIKRNDFFPLGDGGMLISYLKNPKWFIDVHMIIMESDSDIRALGETIEKAKKESKLNDALKFIGGLSTFDPTAISKVITGVDLFTDLLAYFLKQNGDDHVATVHDFYLKHQLFGSGTHPKHGLTKFQNVEVAYTIDLTDL